MHALNKRYALNTEVRLTTRVYGMETLIIITAIINNISMRKKLFILKKIAFYEEKYNLTAILCKNCCVTFTHSM